jgi:hypothetical protein
LDIVTEKTYVHNGEYVGQLGENYVIRLENEDYELSPAAFYVWLKNDGNTSLQQFIADASKELNLKAEELEKPVLMIVEQLLNTKLLKEKSEEE